MALLVEGEEEEILLTVIADRSGSPRSRASGLGLSVK